MLKQLTTTYRSRVAHGYTYLFNTNRVTDFYELGEYAVGTVVITDYAALVSGTDDAIEIAGTTFTSQAAGANLGEPTFQAVTDNDTTATSLAAQINAFDEAGALLVNRVTAVASGANVIITADNYGVAANAYSLVYTDNDTNVGLTVSGATLLGGLDSTTKFWYNERKNDRRDKADEYITSETYPDLQKAVDSSDIQNARIELTTVLRNDETFVKTLNVNLDDIVKVIAFDGTYSRLWLARGAFALDEYKVTHTLAQILALQNAVYKRGTAGTGVAVTEYGDADYHKTVINLSDVTFDVTNANLCRGNLLYTLPEGYAVPTHFIADLKVSGDVSTATPEMGIGSKIGTAGVATIGADDALCEDVYVGIAIGAITPVGVAVALRAEVAVDYFPDQSVAPYDGSAAGMPIHLNFAVAWGATDSIYINGTITLWWLLRGDD